MSGRRVSVRRVRGLATASLWALGEWARDGGGAGIWVRGLAQLFDVDKKRTNLS